MRGRAARGALVALAACCLFVSAACRRDMQDQPRYEPYERTDFFKDTISSRPLVEGTVPRGHLREDAHLYTGKTGNAGVATATGNNAAGSASPGGNLGADSATANTAATTTTSTAATTTTTTAAAGAQQSMPSSTTGRGGTDVDSFPFPINQAVLERGRERYQIFCSMCHGATGTGDGMVVRRGYRQPPSYHTDQLRQAPVGHFFDVITNGWGSMPNYASQSPARDRWAIVAYIRTLQLSEQGSLAEMPPAEREKLLNHSTENKGHEK
ncbi:MAG: cytochrome c [Pyrinomonadaceae bacterium]